jgi:subtilisin family serine protease
VAVADLTPDEIEEASRDEGVKIVVENSMRRIPPIIDMGHSPSDQQSVLEGRSPDLVTYLQGVQDGVALAMGFLGVPVSPHLEGRRSIPTSAGHSWCLSAMGIQPDSKLPDGEGVKVAVLDTGVDLAHPDLQDRIIAFETFVAGEDVQDGHGHGTHCAGVVGGPMHSDGGTRYGVAPGCGLLIGKVLSNAGTGYDDQILDAIDWAAEAGAQVISMSLGSARDVGESYSAAYEAVASKLLESETLIVAAAGNESNRPWYTRPVGNPAACPSILAVAAVDPGLQVAGFSCRRMDDVGQVDISAPGVAVHSAWTGGGFRSISGTSMATPHVAGLAALLLEEGMTGAEPQDVWDALQDTARKLSAPAEDVGSGLAFYEP